MNTMSRMWAQRRWEKHNLSRSSSYCINFYNAKLRSRIDLKSSSWPVLVLFTFSAGCFQHVRVEYLRRNISSHFWSYSNYLGCLLGQVPRCWFCKCLRVFTYTFHYRQRCHVAGLVWPSQRGDGKIGSGQAFSVQHGSLRPQGSEGWIWILSVQIRHWCAYDAYIYDQ